MTLIAEIQRSQLITTYGIGSIYDALDYSVIIAGLENWRPDNTEILYEERLQKKLGVKWFRQPRVIDGVPTIPSYRFPEWVFCQKCKSLKPIYALNDRIEKKCVRCKEKYVPARFVISCPNGHLDDFPWNWWVHEGRSCERPKLKIHATGRTTSLAGIKISCENEDCEAERTLEGIFSKNALRGLTCRGRRPWLGPHDNEDCEEKSPKVLQRGSASVYYSVNESAISIPPFSERIQIFLRGYEQEIKYLPENTLHDYFVGILERTGESFRVEDLVDEALKRKNPADADETILELRQAEYEALCHPSAMNDRDDFAAAEEDPPPEYREQISRLILVHRLREVRALTGFTRIEPDNKIAPISRSHQNWLPATELKGEGIFIELNRKRMDEWVSDAEFEFIDRVQKIEKLRQNMLVRNRAWTELRSITPQFLLIHTLAHILIQQFILHCGYSSSSLRERLYINDGSDGKPEMSGFLIYTATSDSEGSLGGLVRQGNKNRFYNVLKKALDHARWCSNDPLCMESVGQGLNSLNLAACHSCSLLPETSCELRNCYLDRGVIIGVDGRTETGFFPK